jgi:hypothetical protein
VSKVQLNLDIVGPDNDEFDRAEEAASRVNDMLEETFEAPERRVHWSWGDSNSWRVILGVPTEADLTGLVSSEADAALATRLVQIIGTVVELNEDFRLFLELDSNERVNANEGWFLRLKSDPGREQIFVWNREKLSRA